ncbi:41647_t:CDS:2 [Gigaspora margarita]|uniref:41647_t:CDS:1 n=1 Tax=Gigaspora margarita TaxID=4874 RepID=A0ABN7URW9_GIGMA|nr:41647_t:CDS:2 [Gigaspora margarita]
MPSHYQWITVYPDYYDSIDDKLSICLFSHRDNLSLTESGGHSFEEYGNGVKNGFMLLIPKV